MAFGLATYAASTVVTSLVVFSNPVTVVVASAIALVPPIIWLGNRLLNLVESLLGPRCEDCRRPAIWPGCRDRCQACADGDPTRCPVVSPIDLNRV
jgi:hypothetical protein